MPVDEEKRREGSREVEPGFPGDGESRADDDKKRGRAPAGSKKRWRREDYEKILERMREQHRTLKEVCSDPDLPKYASWYKFTRERPELVEQARRIHHDLPYAVQFKIKDVSPQFRIDCLNLRDKGMSPGRIAETLGVSIQTVRRNLPEGRKKEPPKYGQKDFDAVLERMAKERRALSEVCKDPDLPSKEACGTYEKKHPEFKEKFLRIHDLLPYSTQLKTRRVAPRFRMDCVRLRAGGMGLERIANHLKVSIRPVSRVLRMGSGRSMRVEEARKELLGELKGPLPPFPDLRGLNRGVQWRREDYEAVLERMREQKRPLGDVCKDRDLPGIHSWRKNAKKHPGLAEQARQIHFSLPYSVQLRTRDVSPRFREECERMRALGTPLAQIAKTLGVSQQTVWRMFPSSNRRKRANWARQDFETVLERMRVQRRALMDVCRDSDLPSKTSWRRFIKKHPEFMEKAHEIHHDLPYSMQLKCRDVSPEFQIDCKRLRAGDMSLQAIADFLKVPERAVARALRGVYEPTPTTGNSRIDAQASGQKPLPPIGRDYRKRLESGDFHAVLDRMESNKLPLYEVLRAPDLPSQSSWNAFGKKHPEFVEKARRIHHGLPYAVQLRIRDVSPKFRVECERMRSRRMSLDKIAKTLGVSTSPVARILKEFDAKMGLLDGGVGRKWRRRDFEAILTRMRKQKRLLTDVCNDPDLPGYVTWRHFLKTHPEFNEKLEEAYYSLPYHLQLKSGRVSPRFSMECNRPAGPGHVLDKDLQDPGSLP